MVSIRQEKHVRTLKMAVHAGNPGPYVHKVINKLVDRLHSAKNWLVRPGARTVLSLVLSYGGLLKGM